jgi:DNA-directed RNA polymerase subunit RPC12/RpoP
MNTNLVEYTYKCKPCWKVLDSLILDVNEDHPDSILCPSCGEYARVIKISEYRSNQYNDRLIYGQARRETQIKGFDKSQTKRFYTESIEASKKRHLTGNHQYASYEFTPELCQKMGGKRRTEEQQSKVDKSNFKATVDAHKKAGIAPTKKHKQS